MWYKNLLGQIEKIYTKEKFMCFLNFELIWENNTLLKIINERFIYTISMITKIQFLLCEYGM